MTCLELMKKLRPDLSEEKIIEDFCPETKELHMKKKSPVIVDGFEVCGVSCEECWNREVDEEMVYFQDEKESLLKELKNEQELVDRIDELESENNHLKYEVCGLEFKRGYNDGVNEREIVDLKDRVKDMDKIILRQQKENVGLKDKVKELERLNCKLRTETENSRLLKGRAEYERDKYKKECELLEEVIDELETDTKAMRENFDSAMELVSKRDREIDELKDEIKELKSSRNSLLEEYNRFMNDHRGLGKERDSFKRENEFFKEKIKELEEKNALLNAKNEKLRQEFDLCVDANAFIKKNYAELMKKNETLQEDLNYAMETRNKFDDDCIKLQNRVADLMSEITELKRQNEKLRNWKSARKREIFTLRSVIKGIEATTGKEILGSIKSVDKEFNNDY